MPSGSESVEHIARRLVVEDSRCAGIPELERKWYYGIEVEPGVWTRSSDFENVCLTREALRRIEVSGLRCLDIGTMEGLIPLLLERRGAREVVAYDRLDFSERVAFLREKLGASFELISRIPLGNLQQHLRDTGGDGAVLFDLVVFSGVLYHMLDPLGGLLMARRHLRNGGIMILETAALLSAGQSLRLNARGSLLAGDNYWLPELGCLDTLLRLARLQPLDALYLGKKPGLKRWLKPKNIMKRQSQAIRVCVPCLAVNKAPRDPKDMWLAAEQRKDFAEYLNWELLENEKRAPLTYETSGRNRIVNDFGSVDLYRTVRANDPVEIKDVAAQVRLKLGAIY